MINVEKIVTSWINTGNLGAFAAGEHPETFDAAWILLTLIDERPDAGIPARSHGTAYLQLDCYAGADNSQIEAQGLAIAVLERLDTLPGIYEDGAAIVSAVTDGSRRRIPDTELQPARERYIVECIVHGHSRA